MEDEKSTHGGARAGAGRKKGGTNKGEHKTGRIVISCLESQKEAIAKAAAESGMTLAAYVLSRCGVADK